MAIIIATIVIIGVGVYVMRPAKPKFAAKRRKYKKGNK